MALTTGTTLDAAPPKIAMEEFMVPAVDPGIRLYVRNKHPQGAKKFSAERILLYVHGATYPSETAFDLKLEKNRLQLFTAVQQFLDEKVKAGQ